MQLMEERQESRQQVISRRVRELREDEGWTQAELAELASVSQVTISHIETMDKKPRPSTVRKVAEVFGLTPKELMRGQDSFNGSS